MSNGTKTPISYEERLEQVEKRSKRVRVTVACAGILLAGYLFYYNENKTEPPPPPSSGGYYTGPWVNKNGDLVGDDGKILEKDYRGRTVRKAQARRPTPGRVAESLSP